MKNILKALAIIITIVVLGIVIDLSAYIVLAVSLVILAVSAIAKKIIG